MRPPEQVMEKARALGFDLVGFAPAGEARHGEAFRRWVERGWAGDMAWMRDRPERRIAASCGPAVVVGLRYHVGEPPPELWGDPLRGRVARYAWGRDYHDVMTGMLRNLAKAVGFPDARVCVDSSAVLERDLAERGGLGFIGKNTHLINPRMGSYMLLGELFADFRFEPGPGALPPIENRPSESEQACCAKCTRCLAACPTGALVEPYALDARRCISHLTIEHRGPIPEALRPRLGHWLFGCDACQEVCPWVRAAFRREGPATPHRFLRFEPDTCAPRLADVLLMDEAAFRLRFAGTPLERTGLSRLRRNAAVALGNCGRWSAAPVLEKAAGDPDPMVREHTQWALARLRS